MENNLAKYNKVAHGTFSLYPSNFPLGVYTRESHEETYIIFIEILLRRAKSEERNKYLMIFKWINKLYFHTLEFYIQ